MRTVQNDGPPARTVEQGMRRIAVPVYRVRMYDGFRHTLAADRVVVNGDNVCLERSKHGTWVAALQLPKQLVVRVLRRCVGPDGAVTWRVDEPVPATYDSPLREDIDEPPPF